jgi:alpha-galactosidase
MDLNATMIYQTDYQIETVIEISTNNTLLLLGVNTLTGELLQFYYGKRIQNPLELIPQGRPRKGEESTTAYSSFGGGDNSATLRVTHADGALSTELIYQSHQFEQVDNNTTQTTILLKDKYYPFFVELNYSCYQQQDVIESWVVFFHNEEHNVVLNQYSSVEISFANHYKHYYLTSFQGLWEREHALQEEKLEMGKKVLDNRYGTWSSFGHNPSFMLSLGAPADEKQGEVIAGALAWSGCWNITFNYNNGKLYHDTSGRRLLTVTAGIDNFATDYHLPPEDKLSTPKFIMTYSDKGRGQASRNLHNWARSYKLLDGELERPILLNSWEGLHFDFDETKLLEIMDGTAAMGGEMFVLDDGWFGNIDNARNGPDRGLGDWQVNKQKLPNGLAYLAEQANARGLKFGLWVEPEMVNPNSELFKTHPEWVIQQPHREQILYRNQLILDLSNPLVQDFVFSSVSDIINQSLLISYIKWDCNRSFTNPGSQYLPKNQQTHIWYEYVNGLYKVYDRLIKAHPQVMFQACASGGGRVDYGMLARNHEFWTSDNTDAVQRIFIQWGTNYIYPAIATAAHVTFSPNIQTQRHTPLKFRFDVAMSGRLGLELKPEDMQEDELVFVKSAIQTYKMIRPTVMFGDLYRLASPYDEHFAACMYVSQDGQKAVIFAYNLSFQLGQSQPHITLDGLQGNQNYMLKEINKLDAHSHCSIENSLLSGEVLMTRGLSLNFTQEYDSAVLKLSLV